MSLLSFSLPYFYGLHTPPISPQLCSLNEIKLYCVHQHIGLPIYEPFYTQFLSLCKLYLSVLTASFSIAMC